jgi:hypothetical protein
MGIRKNVYPTATIYTVVSPHEVNIRQSPQWGWSLRVDGELSGFYKTRDEAEDVGFSILRDALMEELA